jgi:hypothetical protein
MDMDAQANEVKSFTQKGNYHAALNIALSALNACRRDNDQAGVDRFLGLMQDVLDTLALESGSAAHKARAKDA